MTEDRIRQATGLSIREHQHRTVTSYLSLSAIGLPVVPVLQGQSVDDYLYCRSLYESAGVKLNGVVGVGSLCRRQATAEIKDIARTLANSGLKIHGFGVKTLGLLQCPTEFVSVDSLAWSFGARYDRHMQLPQCQHQHCGNCIKFAQQWRQNLLRRAPTLY